MIQITGGFQDTRNNGEDFALTPFLFLVYASTLMPIINKKSWIFGIGICWGWYSVFIGIRRNFYKQIPKFTVELYKKK